MWCTEQVHWQCVSLLRDVAHFASTSGSLVGILSLDQEKAFDRVDWGFFRYTLVCVGFGPSFISWVDLFYAGVQSAVKVNDFVTPCFFLSRDVRQGCPLSPLLYVLYARFWLATFDRTPLIPVSSFRVPRIPCLFFLSTRMTRRSSLLLTLLLLLPLRPTKPS